MAILGESEQQAFDDLEIRVFRGYDDGYTAEVRLPDGGVVASQLSALPIESLRRMSDPRTYGIQLFEWLFRDQVADAFWRARQLAEVPTRAIRSGGGIRLRLWLDPQSSELRHLRWECLHDPNRDEPLSLNMAFSRYMRVKAPRGWPVSERPLRMLLVVSNPEGLERFEIADIDLVLEKMIVKGATRRLGEFLKLDRLIGAPTLTEIQAAEERGYHIIHLLAHAVIHDDHGHLILADDEGRVQAVACEAVADAIVRSARQTPYLVFLATPLTAREDGGETLVSLAPLLIEAGVQAVVAIQAPIGVPGLRRFTERFYTVLVRTGVIDVAIADARAEIYDPGRWEWTYPVLYMRTPDAQLFQPLPEALETKVRRSIWKH